MPTDIEIKKESVGNCTHCGKGAKYNSPGIDPKGNLWCNSCVDKDRSDTLFLSIEQYTQNGLYLYTDGVALNGVIVWKDKSAWVGGGSRGTSLTAEEKKLTPIEIATLLNLEYNVCKLSRCTGCGAKMTKDQIAGYPLFAGVNCVTCWDKHQTKLDNERKGGHVCGRCREPYGNCCC